MRFQVTIADVLSSPIRLKAAKFLLTHEAPMSEREIASIHKISHMSINRAMVQLEEINFVYCKTIGNAHMWSVNHKSYAYQAIKKIIETIDFYPSPLDILKKLILEYLPKDKILLLTLFGSIAKNEEHPNSDIDLFIIVKTNKDKDMLEADLEKLSSVCLDMFGNRLAPYALSAKDWKAKKPLAVVKEAEKGLKLYESKI